MWFVISFASKIMDDGREDTSAAFSPKHIKHKPGFFNVIFIPTFHIMSSRMNLACFSKG